MANLHIMETYSMDEKTTKQLCLDLIELTRIFSAEYEAGEDVATISKGISAIAYELQRRNAINQQRPENRQN